MMPGMIMLWSGDVASIPSGWHECDGTMGTPNLRNYFVLGASSGHPPGQHAGSNTHSHSFTGDGHSHTIPEGIGLAAGSDYGLVTESKFVEGETEVVDHKPVYYALCYIMKL